MNNFDRPRFYETPSSMLPTFLADKVEPLIIPAFMHASRVMKANNIDIKNLSLNSAIDGAIFEKLTPNATFSSVVLMWPRPSTASYNCRRREYQRH